MPQLWPKEEWWYVVAGARGVAGSVNSRQVGMDDVSPIADGGSLRIRMIILGRG